MLVCLACGVKSPFGTARCFAVLCCATDMLRRMLETIEWIHHDQALLVVNKPAGLLAVPGLGEAGRDCLSARVQAQCADALVVHRLDMATSGLMLFARGLAVQRLLSMAFERRQVHKRYIAVVTGVVPADDGEINAPLITDWPQRPRQKVDAENGKASRTLWRVLARDVAADCTRLEVQPITGRTHQLRVHLLHIGHPIWGDALYTPPPWPAPRLMLHASHLALQYPGSGQACQFNSAAPF